MKIITQQNYYECGIACLNMLINHYYKNDDDFRANLLDNCNISDQGLNLLELEELAKKYNIQLDSYECNIDELWKINDSNPFILVLNTSSGMHYVIGKIKNKKIKIFDPIGKVYFVEKNNFLKNWTGYICFSKLTKNKLPKLKLNKSIFKNFNLLINLVFLGLNIIHFCLNILASFLTSKLINLDSNLINNDSLWKLSFIFLVFIIFNSGFDLINKRIKLSFLYHYQTNGINIFFNNLRNKKNNFFNCYNKSQICHFLKILNEIIYFYIFSWCDIFIHIFMIIISFCLLLLVIKSIWFFLLCYFFIHLIFIKIKFQIDDVFNKQALENQIIIDEKLNFYLMQKINNQNYYEDNLFFEKIVFNTKNLYKKQLFCTYKINLINFVNNVIDNFVKYLIFLDLWKNTNLTLGTLFFLFYLLNVFSNSIGSVLTTLKNYYHIKPINKNLISFLATNNISSNNENKLKWLQPITLTYKTWKISHNLHITTDDLKSHYLVKSLVEQTDLLNEVKINNFELNKYSSNDINKNLIFINNDYQLSKESFNKILQTESFQNLIKISEFNLFNLRFLDLSQPIRYYLILSSLKNVKNAIICFNNWNFNCENNKLNDEINKLLSKLNENNFLISNSLSDQLIKFYEWQI